MQAPQATPPGLATTMARPGCTPTATPACILRRASGTFAPTPAIRTFFMRVRIWACFVGMSAPHGGHTCLLPWRTSGRSYKTQRIRTQFTPAHVLRRSTALKTPARLGKNLKRPAYKSFLISIWGPHGSRKCCLIPRITTPFGLSSRSVAFTAASTAATPGSLKLKGWCQPICTALRSCTIKKATKFCTPPPIVACIAAPTTVSTGLSSPSMHRGNTHAASSSAPTTMR